jgi:hypothetical protein
MNSFLRVRFTLFFLLCYYYSARTMTLVLAKTTTEQITESQGLLIDNVHDL